jgi:hypothetical protein
LNQDHNVIAPGATFRNVFILESRDWWSAAQPDYDPARDLVLTYDFGLRRDVEALGGTARYVDHLCAQSVMQENNFRMYRFFHDWHLDADGADIFRYREIPFGFSFRIEIWNDFTFYVRSQLCLDQLRTIIHQTVIVGTSQQFVHEILRDMGIDFRALEKGNPSLHGVYFFPIHRWMDEQLHSRRLRHVIRDIVVTVQGVAMSWYDDLVEHFFPKTRIYVQEYHPTHELLRRLQRQPGIRVVQGHFSATSGVMKFLRDRPIPIYGNSEKYRSHAAGMIEAFQQKRVARLILSTGADATDAVNRVIERRITGVLPTLLRALDCVIRYLDKHPIRLEILIANVGHVAMLVDCVAKARGIPSYLIVNGLLGAGYLDEGKYATVINAYSPSIRDHYFRDMSNIVCLGDPRMDEYALSQTRNINRDIPTITIGASGFSNIDLNSYLAVEFEFLCDVLTVMRNLTMRGRRFRVVLKVRANGYSELYRAFVEEYFPNQLDRLVDHVPMRSILNETDLFISIYSQTLFEASCMGIPTVYHKNDRQILDQPFDGKSELVTTYDVASLERALDDFLAGSERFDAFMEKCVMEKYIGPLDGGNLARNLAYANELLNKSRQRSGQ